LHRLTQARLSSRLDRLLLPIGVGVGIGIGIDSDGYCGWSSRTVQPRYLSFVSIVQKRQAQPTYAIDVRYTSGFSWPNPIFCPSIPIPIPTPTPIIIPTAIPGGTGTGAGGRRPPGGFPQKANGQGSDLSFAQMALSGDASCCCATLATRCQCHPRPACSWSPSVSGSESGSGSIPTVIVVGPHARCSLVTRVSSASYKNDRPSRHTRSMYGTHPVSRGQIPSFVLRFRYRYRPRPRL
jgi:hypothetical protein